MEVILATTSGSIPTPEKSKTCTRYKRLLYVEAVCNPWRETLDPREVDLDQLYGLDRGACSAGIRW